jgi:hypothetical protein
MNQKTLMKVVGVLIAVVCVSGIIVSFWAMSKALIYFATK